MSENLFDEMKKVSKVLYNASETKLLHLNFRIFPFYKLFLNTISWWIIWWLHWENESTAAPFFDQWKIVFRSLWKIPAIFFVLKLKKSPPSKTLIKKSASHSSLFVCCCYYFLFSEVSRLESHWLMKQNVKVTYTFRQMRKENLAQFGRKANWDRPTSQRQFNLSFGPNIVFAFTSPKSISSPCCFSLNLLRNL